MISFKKGLLVLLKMKQFWIAVGVLVLYGLLCGPGDVFDVLSGSWLGFWLGALWECKFLTFAIDGLHEQSKIIRALQRKATDLAAQSELAWKDLKLARRALAAHGEETDWLEARLFGLSAALRPFDTPDRSSREDA